MCVHMQWQTHLCCLGLAGVGEQRIAGSLVFGHVDTSVAHVILEHCYTALLLHDPVSETNTGGACVISSVQCNSSLKCSSLNWARGQPDGDFRVDKPKICGWGVWGSPMWIPRRAPDVYGVLQCWHGWPKTGLNRGVKSTFQSQNEHLSSSACL